MTRLPSKFADVRPGTKYFDTQGNDLYFELIDERGAYFVEGNTGDMVLIKAPYINYKGRLEYSKLETVGSAIPGNKRYV